MSEHDLCFSIAGLCVSKKIDISYFVTIALFVLGIISSRYFEEKKKLNVRKTYLIALIEEINLNIEVNMKSHNMKPSSDAMRTFIEKSPSNRPLITFTYHSTIFKNRTEVLQDLPNKLIKNIVDFYGKMDSISNDVEAIDRKAFEAISVTGRADYIEHIFTKLEVALQLGKSVSDTMELQLDSFGGKS